MFTFSSARLEYGVIVIQVLDISRADIIFRFCAGFVVRFFVDFNIRLAVTHGLLFVETLTQRLTVTERAAEAAEAAVAVVADAEWRHFLQINHVNGYVAQVVRHADLQTSIN